MGARCFDVPFPDPPVYEPEDDDLHHVQALADAHARQRDRKHAHRKKKPRFHEPPPDPDAPTRRGLVLDTARGHATVRVDGETWEALVSPALRLQRLATGDEVTVSLGEVVVVRRLLPRRTSLCRRNPHQPHAPKIVVANVDWVAIVGAASDPPFRPGLVDRYLMAVHHGGAVPIVVVNKVDEAPDRAALDEVLAQWSEAGIRCIACSARTGEALDALLDAMGPGRGALVGHSGVGKSSLLAALGADALAGDLADHGRGRHTTSGSHLYVFHTGAEVIDTPGVRAFAPWEATRGDLAAAFPDVERHAARCGFSSCSHAHEGDCAVLDAIDAGDLDAARVGRYLRLMQVELR